MEALMQLSQDASLRKKVEVLCMLFNQDSAKRMHQRIFFSSSGVKNYALEVSNAQVSVYCSE